MGNINRTIVFIELYNSMLQALSKYNNKDVLVSFRLSKKLFYSHIHLDFKTVKELIKNIKFVIENLNNKDDVLLVTELREISLDLHRINLDIISSEEFINNLIQSITVINDNIFSYIPIELDTENMNFETKDALYTDIKKHLKKSNKSRIEFCEVVGLNYSTFSNKLSRKIFTNEDIRIILAN